MRRAWREGYRLMYDAYTRIFTRMGLKFRAVQADGGSIGGDTSQEFHVLADSGEDAIAFSDGDDYAANLETAATLAAAGRRARPPAQAADQGAHARTRAPLRSSARCWASTPAQCVKTLLVDGSDGGVVALVVRGDHELNAREGPETAPASQAPCSMASAERVRAATGTEPGFHRVRSASTAGSMWTMRRRIWPISSAAPTRRICTIAA